MYIYTYIYIYVYAYNQIKLDKTYTLRIDSANPA